MTLLKTAPRSRPLARTVRSTATRVVLGGTALAWLALAVPWPGSESAPGAGHAHHHAPAAPTAADVVDPWTLAWAGTWLLMVVAMMWPLMVPTVDAVAASVYRGWRTRLGAVALATGTLLWLAVGVVAASVALVLGVRAGSLWWQLPCVAVALAASRSARRSRLLWRCSRLPALAPGGARGVVTAARAGALAWRRCVLLCGPVMLAMTVGHSLVLMLCASLAAWWEAWHPRAWRDPVPVLLLSGAGLWLVVVRLVGATHG